MPILKVPISSAVLHATGDTRFMDLQAVHGITPPSARKSASLIGSKRTVAPTVRREGGVLFRLKAARDRRR